MSFTSRCRSFVIPTLILFLSDVPYVAAAEVSLEPNKMISTTVVVGEMNRVQAQESVAKFLDRSDVQAQLQKHGVSREEAQMRLASLSDQELKQMAQQMDQARAGGDLGGLLILVVLVLLIIYLAKRI